jgi:hypothetical protein
MFFTAVTLSDLRRFKYLMSPQSHTADRQRKISTTPAEIFRYAQSKRMLSMDDINGET